MLLTCSVSAVTFVKDSKGSQIICADLNAHCCASYAHWVFAERYCALQHPYTINFQRKSKRKHFDICDETSRGFRSIALAPKFVLLDDAPFLHHLLKGIATKLVVKMSQDKAGHRLCGSSMHVQ
eukprot:3565833-Amphidinium_carterae.1